MHACLGPGTLGAQHAAQEGLALLAGLPAQDLARGVRRERRPQLARLQVAIAREVDLAAADALAKLKDSLEIPAQALWEKVPGITQEEVRRWKAAADAERNAAARAQATAFGLDVVNRADGVA